METNASKSRDIKSQIPPLTPNFAQGLYHSNTINKDSRTVYEFIKNESNIKKVLTDIPEELNNFLNLKLESSDSDTVTYKNAPDTKVKGTLTFDIGSGPAGKGTVLSVQAMFENYSLKDETPSDLINVFLKRVKAMIETGVLATTKGQPNGEDKIEEPKLKH